MTIKKGTVLDFCMDFIESSMIPSGQVYMLGEGTDLMGPGGQSEVMPMAWAKNVQAEADPAWKVSDLMGTCNHPVIKTLSIEKMMLDLSYKVYMVTHFGTTVEFKVPKQMELPLSSQLTHEDLDRMLDLGTRVGVITHHTNQSSGSQAWKDQKVFVGGPRNGETTSSSINPFQIVQAEPLSGLAFDSLEAVKTLCKQESYWLESVACQVQGLTHTAMVYRHESVPPNYVADMFMSELEEFPTLRVMPSYYYFWVGVNK